MNDFRKIRTARYQLRFLPHHALARHLQARAFLEAEMRKPCRGPLMVVTHHAPIPRPACRSGDRPLSAELSEDEILDPAYRSDLRSLMWPRVNVSDAVDFYPADAWIHGHTHESEDTVIGSTRVFSNAKGYGYPISDNPHFDPNLVIEI